MDAGQNVTGIDSENLHGFADAVMHDEELVDTVRATTNGESVWIEALWRPVGLAVKGVRVEAYLRLRRGIKGTDCMRGCVHQIQSPFAIGCQRSHAHDQPMRAWNSSQVFRGFD